MCVYVLRCIRCGCVWERVSLCSSDWPSARHPPDSASWVLAGLQAHTLGWASFEDAPEELWPRPVVLTPVTGSAPWSRCILPPFVSICGWEPRVPTPACWGSTFCFAPWLLATCFLHSAHSVSHFTLLKAERSIHLVQTLLTRLGWRGPSLGSVMAFWGWVAHTGQDGYIHLCLLSGFGCLSQSWPMCWLIFLLWILLLSIFPSPSLSSHHPSHPKISKHIWLILHGNLSCKVFSSTFLKSHVP